jgi:hypothetical protein
MLFLRSSGIFPIRRPKGHIPVHESTGHAIMNRMHVRDSYFKRPFARQPVHDGAKLFRGVLSRQ